MPLSNIDDVLGGACIYTLPSTAILLGRSGILSTQFTATARLFCDLLLLIAKK